MDISISAVDPKSFEDFCKRNPQIINNWVSSVIQKRHQNRPDCDAVFHTVTNATVRICSNAVTKQWDGRDVLVAPVVLLVEGVHNGSQGPVYYSAELLEQSANLWNGVPLPVYHPETIDPVTNTPVNISCNSPEVIQNQSIGWLFNVVYEATPVPRLKGELFVDIQKANRVSPPTLEALRRGSQLEVSTGLFSIDNESPGTWNGERYSRSVVQMFPDHLALLPGQSGACSWSDGCGVRANQGGSMDQEETINESVKDVMERKPGILNRFFGWINQLKGNEASYEQKRRAVQRVLDSMDSRTSSHYLRAMFDDRIVYAVDPGPESAGQQTKLYQREYAIDANGAVTLGNDVKEVREDLSFVEVAGNGEGEEKGGASAAIENKSHETETQKEVPAMVTDERKQKVNALISNGKFVEADRSVLETCSCETFAKFEAMMATNAAASADPPAPKDDVTFESLLGKAPKHIQDRFTFVDNQIKELRSGLINRIKSNKSNKLTDAQLEAMSDDLLRATADSFAPVANYSASPGAFTPATVTDNAAEAEEPMTLPEMVPAPDKK